MNKNFLGYLLVYIYLYILVETHAFGHKKYLLAMLLLAICINNMQILILDP